MESIAVGSGTMPLVGLGLWKIDEADTATAVVDAIRAGYRHLDSASDYGNEVAVGRGISTAIDAGLCRREDLWVTSKLWNTFHDPKHVAAACQRSLDDLGLDYLDLYLVHFPIAQPFVDFADRYPPGWFFEPQADAPSMELAAVPLSDTWRAMEELVEQGLVREIGICNYNSGLIHDLMTYAKRPPAMLQIESHPYLSQEALLRTAASYNIPVTAFSPLGALSYVALDMASDNESVLDEAVVLSAAQRVQRTPAQVVLRWAIQRGTAVIPKTSRSERLIENSSLFDFSLSGDEMAAISGLNRNRRFNDPGVFCEAAFNRFHAIYD
ncbi:aldo/keto reductase [Congregibacter variabilis]|uniref:Aldo/keto reductase n=1 Tax=Congregibacter variabilis TaxID=3081200 RepID=A0ABZ0I7F7_9GAMM|nr:aldo/keto reductase [Congregibacter sp. IMCC43200]